MYYLQHIFNNFKSTFEHDTDSFQVRYQQIKCMK